MKVVFSQKFIDQYRHLPTAIQEKFHKQLESLLQNLHHNSLRAKKYDEPLNIWQARVDRRYRFYFTIGKDTYQMLSIRAHPK